MANETEHYAAQLFPDTYASWRYCIEVKCGLRLTSDFLQARITAFGNQRHEESKRFAALYGEAYRDQVLAWFQRAAGEI